MNIHVSNTAIVGVKLIEQFRASDTRGEFTKTFHQTALLEQGIDFQLKESFYSLSHQHVIRGMHFHHPPYEHAKIIFCTSGAILDVALDLRTNSSTYGRYVTAEISAENHRALYIPRGFAHGFLSLSPHTCTFYLVDGSYQREADDGIRYDSFGLDWPLQSQDIILSARDAGFLPLSEFISPF